jgi:hypothetical protein
VRLSRISNCCREGFCISIAETYPRSRLAIRSKRLGRSFPKIYKSDDRLSLLGGMSASGSFVLLKVSRLLCGVRLKFPELRSREIRSLARAEHSIANPYLKKDFYSYEISEVSGRSRIVSLRSTNLTTYKSPCCPG